MLCPVYIKAQKKIEKNQQYYTTVQKNWVENLVKYVHTKIFICSLGSHKNIAVLLN